MPQQQCRLCLGLFDRLQNSHFLPAGVYRRLNGNCDGNPNPWEISSRGHVQTSRQRTAHILCAECEQLFSTNGEDWVLRHCLQRDDAFPLKRILDNSVPELARENTKLFRAKTIESINTARLTYFGMSMFWRASAYNWFSNWLPPINFGPYAEGVRKFLMSEATFPESCFLITVVREPSNVSSITYTPSGRRVKTYYMYKFLMPGIAFLLAVGKQTPEILRTLCINHGQSSPIIMSSDLEDNILEEASRLYAAAIPPQR